MKSSELAQEVRNFAEFCATRIEGVGDEQYSEGDKQRFESYSPEKLLSMIDEELADIVNYSVMTRIRLRTLMDRCPSS